MNISVRFPRDPEPTTAKRLVADLDGTLAVGDERVRDFLVAFSRRLLRPDLARAFPELGSLGFFLRRGELAKAVDRLVLREGTRRAPRGLVLHFPPANVDTIFVYSWALSALAGNRNIVRVSGRSAGAAEAVLDALNDVLATADPIIGRTQRMVTYERDDATTAALSGAADLRVLWGGDRSVNALRAFAVPPLARDLTFPDRSSFAAVSVPAWQAADPASRRAAVEGFANDLYWFDQAACSSPRDLFWVGDPGPAAAARAEFTALLAEVVAARGWGVDAAMAVEKHVATYGLAASGAATRVAFAGNAVASVELSSVATVQREWLGAGTICHVTIPALADLAAVVQRKDQTLSYFGFGAAELDAFVTALAGRGIDRIVPFGQALTFAGVWDGFDLLHEFSRIITVQV
jgi:hypothetical protein